MTNYVLLLRMSISGKIGETGDGGIGRAQPDGVIRFEADNVSSLDDVYSPEVEVKGVPWKLNVYKGEVYLHLFLFCIPKQSTQWEIDMDAEFSLIHPDNSKNINKKKTETLHNEHTCFSGGIILNWNELIDDGKGFIKDDKITVEIRFWINNMRGIKNIPRINFSDPADPRHDVALVIEGEKIYASKQILAVHSPVFHTMFYGDFNEKGKQEIELKDEFLEMLRVIYTCRKKITDESAVYLLELGDRFQIACVIEFVEEFLIASEETSNMEKLQIADQFRLFGLLKHCLSDLKTTEDFKNVQESSIFGSLSPDTLRSLFMRHLKIAK